MIKFDPYVVTYCSISKTFDFGLMRHHIRENLDIISNGNHTTHVTVAIVKEFDDCQPMIEELKQRFPYKGTGYAMLENLPQKGLSDMEKAVLGLMHPTLKLDGPDLGKMTDDERAEYCEENFDLEFPDDYHDDPFNRL